MAFTAPPLHIPDVQPILASYYVLDSYADDATAPRMLSWLVNQGQVFGNDNGRGSVTPLELWVDAFHSYLDIDTPTNFEDRTHYLWDLMRGRDFITDAEEHTILQAASRLLVGYWNHRAREYTALADLHHENALLVEKRFPNYEGLDALWHHQETIQRMASDAYKRHGFYEALCDTSHTAEMMEQHNALNIFAT